MYTLIKVKKSTYNKIVENSDALNISILDYIDSLVSGKEIDYTSVEECMKMLNKSRYMINKLIKDGTLEKTENGYITNKSIKKIKDDKI
jgi:hypothetical protein